MAVRYFFGNETSVGQAYIIVQECVLVVASDHQGVMQGCVTFDSDRVALGSRFYTGLLGNVEVSAEKGTRMKVFLKIPGYEFISAKDTSVAREELEYFFEFGENVCCIPFWVK